MFTSSEQTLLVQAFRIFSEQICPYKTGEKEPSATLWSNVQTQLSMELGRVSLSPLTYNYMGEWLGKPHHHYGNCTIDHVCQTWFLQSFDGSIAADQFINERMSFIELGFRLREAQIDVENANLPAAIKAADAPDPFKPGAMRVPGKYSVFVKGHNATINRVFRDGVEELNTRFRQADCNLNYHNGFIQLARDSVVETQIEAPFWRLVSGSKWKNVDTDIKEAFDRRDTGARDPALHAARALESTIKIISGDNGWTHGKEKGAHNFIENLTSNNFIADWEASALKHVFTAVRNPLSHGPGAAAMAVLTKEQTDWAIEACLSWIKSLIRRS